MTKAEVVANIARKTGLKKKDVQNTIDTFMSTVKDSLTQGENVYLRGFGSFVIKYKAEKTARNIYRNTSVIIPPHCIPAFKPSNEFADLIKKSVIVA